jgi:hypothetical protein
MITVRNLVIAWKSYRDHGRERGARAPEGDLSVILGT